MTIDDCIDYLNRSFAIDDTDDARQHNETLEKTIATMRKYQKIQEIVARWKVDTWTDGVSYDCMTQISEVIDGA